MQLSQLYTYVGIVAGLATLGAVIKVSFHAQSAKVWREEAEAQKSRADRLQTDMSEIKERLSRIEAENARLIELLTALDPARIAALRI
jgi:predicted nuclease with TOPRIM domain